MALQMSTDSKQERMGVPAEGLPTVSGEPFVPGENYKSGRYARFKTKMIDAGLLVDFTVDYQRLDAKLRRKGQHARYDHPDVLALKDSYLLKHQEWLSEGIVLEKLRAKDPIERLRSLARKVPSEREATREQIMLWVGNHLGSDASEIDTDTLPCRWAVILLAEVAGDDKLKRQFVSEFLSFTKNRAQQADVKQGSDKHLRDLLGQLPEQGGDQGAAGGRGQEQGSAERDSGSGQGLPAAG